MSSHFVPTNTALTASHFRQEAQHLESWRAGLTEAQIVQINLDCIRFHCETFGINRNDRVLSRLESLVRVAGNSVIESSVKVANGTEHPARFNILCAPGDKASFLEELFRFAQDVAHDESIKLDLEPVRNIFAGADLSRVSRMVCGVDIRQNRPDSRLKIWVFASHRSGDRNDPVERALASGDADERFHFMHVHPDLLFGYDLPFGGLARLKMYPDVWEHELDVFAVRSRLAGVLPESSFDMITEAYWTHFYLRGGESSLAFDLHLKRPDEFVERRLANPIAARIHAAYRGVPLLDVVAAVACDAADQARIEDFTLYYMPAGFSHDSNSS